MPELLLLPFVSFAADPEPEPTEVDAEPGTGKWADGQPFRVYRGLIFRAGEYPDLGVFVSEDDLGQFSTRFESAPIKVAHLDTPFDGLVGSLVKVWKRGGALYGELQVHEGIASVLGQRFKVSVGLDVRAKRISEISICTEPRVPGAQVAAVTHSQSTQSGTRTMSKPQETVRERIKALFGGREPNEQELASVQFSAGSPAQAPTQPPVVPPATPPAPPKTETPPPVAFSDPRVDEMARQLVEMQTAHVEREADDFAMRFAREGRITPAQIPQVKACFAALLRSDHGGTLKFTGGQLPHGEGVKAFSALLGGLPTNPLTGAQFASAPGDQTLKPPVGDDPQSKLNAAIQAQQPKS